MYIQRTQTLKTSVTMIRRPVCRNQYTKENLIQVSSENYNLLHLKKLEVDNYKIRPQKTNTRKKIGKTFIESLISSTGVYLEHVVKRITGS